MTVQQEMYNSTHSTLVSVSSLAVQLDKTTSVTPTPVQQNLSAVFATIAGPRDGSNTNTFQLLTRPCGQLKHTTPTQNVPGDLTLVRTLNLTNPDLMLVVDAHYRYTPLFFRFITGPIDFWSSGYWPVRSFDPGAAAGARWTRYDIANQNGGAGKCNGYS